MGPCVWIVGRCPRKLEQSFIHLSRSYQIPVARCHNIQEMTVLLYQAQYPSILICGSNVPKFNGERNQPIPVVRAKDPMAKYYLEHHLKYVL